jgi:hypothetical protein
VILNNFLPASTSLSFSIYNITQRAKIISKFPSNNLRCQTLSRHSSQGRWLEAGYKIGNYRENNVTSQNNSSKDEKEP